MRLQLPGRDPESILMRVLCFLSTPSVCLAQHMTAEKLIENSPWKRARTVVGAQIRQAPNDAQSNFLLSQTRSAFGDRSTPLPRDRHRKGI